MVRALTVLLTLAAAAPLVAQDRAGDLHGIPAAYFPPPNTCRIWLDDVPPEHQHAPMDCATAERVAPAHARIIYGVTARSPSRDRAVGASGGVDRRRPDCSSPLDRSRVECRSGSDRGDGSGGTADVPVSSGAAMPTMLSARAMTLGRRTQEVRTWLGDGPLGIRLEGVDRDGSIGRALWFDGSRQIVQVWIDGDRDGRVDQVQAYRAGRLAQVFQ